MANFQLVSASYFKSYIKYNDTNVIELKIKNVTGRNLARDDYSITLQRTSAEVAPYVIPSGRYAELDLIESVSGTWNNNTTKTFTVSVNPTDSVTSSTYDWSESTSYVIENLTTNRAFQTHILASYWDSSINRHDTVFDLPCYYGAEYYNPKISQSRLERALSDGTANDEGEKLKSSFRLASSAQTFINNFSLKAYYKQDGTPTTTDYTGVITYDSATTPSISQIVSDGITDSLTFISRTDDFSNGSNWGFLFVFGDQYESTTATYSIPRAFANVHLSGATTGGVAFGKFSRSTNGKPLFECRYPIEGVNLYELTETASGSGYFTSDVDTGGRIYKGDDVYAVHKFTLLDMNTHSASSATTITTGVVVPINVANGDIFMSMYGGFTSPNSECVPASHIYNPSNSYNGVWISSADNGIRYRITGSKSQAFVVIEYATRI